MNCQDELVDPRSFGVGEHAATSEFMPVEDADHIEEEMHEVEEHEHEIEEEEREEEEREEEEKEREEHEHQHGML
jgi:hypothetical protein